MACYYIPYAKATQQSPAAIKIDIHINFAQKPNNQFKDLILPNTCINKQHLWAIFTDGL
jgi:hypothetical protein